MVGIFISISHFTEATYYKDQLFYPIYKVYYIFNSMPKRRAHKHGSQSESQEVEDIMAWGNKKENYYQQSQNQYSELSEEEQEAKKIYQNQFQQLQNQDLYQLPSEDNQSVESDGDQQKGKDKQLSFEYLTKQIKNITKLGLRISQEKDSQVRSLLQIYIQTYLMSLISLRQLKIPYVEYHPILNKILEMKDSIAKLKHLLDNSTNQDETDYQIEQEDEINEEQENQNENDISEGSDQHEVEDGLKIYQQIKSKQEASKKQKKTKKKQELHSKKKPAFVEVKDNQGRLASEKILKNKGLIKKRKKIDRNSRVKLRRKFDKATSKRRAYGHLIRENPGREYQGQRNIKYGRIASTKLK